MELVEKCDRPLLIFLNQGRDPFWNQSKSAMLGIADGRSLISDYFLEQSIDAGDRFVEGFGKKCQHLVEFPYLGRNPFMKSRGISLLLTSKGRSQFLITILPLLKSLEDRAQHGVASQSQYIHPFLHKKLDACQIP